MKVLRPSRIAVLDAAEVVYWTPPPVEERIKAAYRVPLAPKKARRRRVVKIDGEPVMYWEPITSATTPLPTTRAEQEGLHNFYRPPDGLAPDIQALLAGLRVDPGADPDVRRTVADKLPAEGGKPSRWPVPCPDSLCRGYKGKKIRAYAPTGGGKSVEDHAPWCSIWDRTGSAPF